MSKEDASVMDDTDELIAYESFAAVLSRYQSDGVSAMPATPARDLRWSDLNRPRVHLAQLLNGSSKRNGSQRARKRTLKRSGRSGSADLSDMYVWEMCFEFLNLKELERTRQVCKEWRSIITNSRLLLFGMYCRQWCPLKPTIPQAFMELSYDDLVLLNMNRSPAMSMELSTRGSVGRRSDGLYEVVNNSMLRSFTRGSIDSIRGNEPLPVLSCAEALRMRVAYYEVSMKGCGSVGIVSLSDEASKQAYGFGSEEHVGWKGISYGYHGNDGDIVYNDGTAAYGGEWKPFGPSWGSASGQSDEEAQAYTIGCGLNMITSEVFYTLNGKMVGVAPITVAKGEYTLAVSLHAFGDSALINIGAAPFMFDIEGHCASP